MNTTVIISVLTLFVIIPQVLSSPVSYSKQSAKSDKERVLYDQRQEGEWNIRADLKNFIIMIIPKSPEVPESSPTASLLDLFTRSHPKHHAKHVQTTNNTSAEVGAETMHFIESKTAPYHVDITKSHSHLMNEEILATQSPITLKSTVESKPTVAQLVPSNASALLRQLRSTRFSKAFVLTVPEEEFVLTKMEDEKKVVKKDGLKKKNNLKKTKEEMVLLGAAEQCGPDMVRDSQGVCRLKKVLDEEE